MANEEHLAILKQGVEVWNRWRQENPDTRPDLGGVDLAEANLTEANLYTALLSGARLYAAHLNGVRLNGVTLEAAYLSGFFAASPDSVGRATTMELAIECALKIS